MGLNLLCAGKPDSIPSAILVASPRRAIHVPEWKTSGDVMEQARSARENVRQPITARASSRRMMQSRDTRRKHLPGKTDLKPGRPIEAYYKKEGGRNVVTLMFTQGVHPGGGG
jgi:hypothetical protein